MRAVGFMRDRITCIGAPSPRWLAIQPEMEMEFRLDFMRQ